MFGFGKKKKKTLEEYLFSVIEKPRVNFQIDILRNGLVEIQITRQRLLTKFGIEINAPEGLAVSISFDKDNYDDWLRFRESVLCFKAIHVEEYGESFFFLCENTWESISTLLKSIQIDIYQYNDSTEYAFRYLEH